MATSALRPRMPYEPAERRKGLLRRVHDTVNRTLVTIALILSIVVLVGLIRIGTRIDSVIGNLENTIGDLGNLGGSGITGTTPPTGGRPSGLPCDLGADLPGCGGG